jgi:PAS domain S-box-containing protein/excisionase family DNA binding protein
MGKSADQNLQEFVTLKEAAVLLKCHQNTLRKWDRNGMLKAVRLGKRKLLRYRKKDIQLLLDGRYETARDQLQKYTKDKFSKIKKYLIENADSIQKQSTKEHKRYLGGKKFRSEIIQEYQDLHIRAVKEIANNLNNEERGIARFKELGKKIATEAVKDELTIEEAVDGLIFLKQGVWKSLEKEKLLEFINNQEFYILNLWIGTFSDIIATQVAFTFHENAVKKTQESEENLKLILDNINDYGIMRLDLKGNVIYWNHGADRQLRYSEREILGKNYSLFFMNDEILHKKPLRELEAARENGSVENENWSVRKDGSKFWSSGTTTVLSDKKGKQYGYIKIIRDRTELKEVENQKDEFVAIISHELKNPITSLIVFTELLQKRFGETDDKLASKALSAIKAQTDKLTNLISNLLERSKIRSKGFLFTDKHFDLDALIVQTIEELQASKASHKIIFNNRSTVTLKADRAKIGQLLYNLISNAIKYSPDAGKIIVSAKKQKKAVTITIQDFGMGISKNTLEKLFTPFFRASETQRETFPSMGLGLYISKEIVNHYNGKIWVETEEGKGSTFYVSLPILHKNILA